MPPSPESYIHQNKLTPEEFKSIDDLYKEGLRIGKGKGILAIEMSGKFGFKFSAYILMVQAIESGIIDDPTKAIPEPPSQVLPPPEVYIDKDENNPQLNLDLK